MSTRTLSVVGIIVVLVIIGAVFFVFGGADQTPPETADQVEQPGSIPIGQEEVATPEAAEESEDEAPAVEAEQSSDRPTLTILQWRSVFPEYNEWFDSFAQAWGAENGIDVTVEHKPVGEIQEQWPTLIEAGEGPTLVNWIRPAATVVEDVHDLTDVNQQAQELYGDPARACKDISYLRATESYFAFCLGWAPMVSNYNIDLWSAIELPAGPQTWEELLEGGVRIRELTEEEGTPVGIPLTRKPGSNSEARMTVRQIIYAYGGSIQDEEENVVFNSPQVIEAVNYMATLYQRAMTEDVLEWAPSTNNEKLFADEVNYILNSISAYRSLQNQNPDQAATIGLAPPPEGPNGRFTLLVPSTVYVIPNYVEESDRELANDFLLHLAENNAQIVFNSKFYFLPAFASTTPDLYTEGKWLDEDPFGSQPPDKLKILNEADNWTVSLGYPGSSNPAVVEVYHNNIIEDMVAQVVTGEISAEEGVAQAAVEIEEIFEKWRAKGLVGGNE